MNTEELEKITYDDATALLGITKGTLHHATSKGILTPLRRRSRQPGQLIKRQVELFIGKDLSLRWLSPQEALTWQEIKNAITAPSPPVVTQTQLALPEVEDTIAFTGALIEGVADLTIELLREIFNAPGLTPDKIIEFTKQSPTVRRLTQLLGIDYEHLPADTAEAINEKAREVAEKVQAKFMALLMEQAAKAAQVSQDEQEPDEQVAPSTEHHAA